MKVVNLSAKPREPSGTRGARRMRRGEHVPGVVYGEGRPPRHVAVETREFVLALERGARVIDLDMEGVGASRVLLKDVQYDALGRKVLHADFVRLHPDHELTIGVPIEFRGTPAGVNEGGILVVQRDNLQVRCLPRNIPDQFEVELSGLALGESLHASDIPLPENVSLADEPTATMVTVSVPRGLTADEQAAEDAAAAEALEAAAAAAAAGDAADGDAKPSEGGG